MPLSLDRLDDPEVLVVVGDALAAGRRDTAGIGLALRVAHRLKMPEPVLPIDLSGSGGLRHAATRTAQLLSIDHDIQAWGVVLLGIEDAARDPLVVQWLDAATAIVGAVRSICQRTVIVTPPPILQGRPCGKWSFKEPRRWAKRVPGMLVERVMKDDDMPDWHPVSVVSLDAMPDDLRADDVWPTAAGYDWMADQVAAGLLQMTDGTED